MLKFFASPLVRLSFGLVMLSVAILLMADLLGLVPDVRKAELNSRKVISESLAVQMSSGNLDEQLATVENLLRAVVDRNDNVLSAAVRRTSDGHVVTYGDHNKWTLKRGDRSTPQQVQVPLYNGRQLWGTVELRFEPLGGVGKIFSFGGSFATVILVMALSGFVAYLFFLKRALRELNPDAVIPERVRTALDTLAEGLLIMDEHGTIVFSNEAFARKIGLKPGDLVGKPSGSMDWEYDAAENPEDLPWTEILEGRALPEDVFIRLRTGFDALYKFAVKATPIMGGGDSVRGALVTFDDVTELEAKNDHLSRTLAKLEESQREITRQNQELHVLATRDPLTGSLNRRAFFQGFETLFNDARNSGEVLSCIMVDIDHFKAVNDTYGHALGDVVIKFLANLLTENSRPTDLVGRLGGEEFCIVLPDAGSDRAFSIADRMRIAVQAGDGKQFGVGLSLTSSFGVVEINQSAKDYTVLTEQSDEALYVAKETGRNRVIVWSPEMQEKHEAAMAAQEEEGGEAAAEPVREAPPATAPVIDESPVAAPVVSEPVAPVAPAAAPVSGDGGSVLSSRMVMVDRIQQAVFRAKRLNSHVAVVTVEVDALRNVREALGSAAEDKFAREAIKRLKEILRSTDTIAMPTESNETGFTVSRLSGDEILLVLTDLSDSDATTTVIKRLFSLQNQPITVEGHEFFAAPGIGISLFPADGEDADSLINKSSSAMREVRSAPGRNRFRFYSDEINQQSKKRIRLEADLRRAVEREEFIVFYQPKANLRTASIQSMEALVRWKHPETGMVPPDQFIPVAEQTGLIDDISSLVLKTVCNQIRHWNQAGYSEIKIAVNLSAAEFRSSDVADRVLNIIRETGIAPSSLDLEVTESLVVHSMEEAIAMLQKLSDAGIGISMDDFGTGYSSLSYLKLFPLSQLKIDRSFIIDVTNGEADAALVSAMIALGHSLGLEVVAEGIETQEQLAFLQDLHCDYAQGYLLCKPKPRDEIAELLADPSEIETMILENAAVYAGAEGGLGLSPLGGTMGVLNEIPVEKKSQDGSG